MPTLDDLKAQITSDLDRTTLSTEISSAIFRSIEHYNRYPLWFLIDRSLIFNTVIDQDIYTSSDKADIANIVNLNQVTFTLNDQIYYLDIRRYGDLETDVDSNSYPVAIAYFNKKLRLYPPPSAVGVIRILGHVGIPAPTAGSDDTTPWTNEAFDLIRFRALQQINRTKIRNSRRADELEGEELKQLESLCREGFRKLGTGRITPSKF